MISTPEELKDKLIQEAPERGPQPDYSRMTFKVKEDTRPHCWQLHGVKIIEALQQKNIELQSDVNRLLKGIEFTESRGLSPRIEKLILLLEDVKANKEKGGK